MSERTGGVVKQLQEASRELSGSSGGLFESSSRQAVNASQQAASVTEMGATVAELRETFNQATAKAESVIELARRSEESSSGGAEAVKQSIDGMMHIREQVAAIAQTIDGLVQRTDQIDAIIDVVNDLAEQSNVLALNAGIEAARAGEHGRGFAVVAREVRSLAERSKESTAQVRAILQDIKLAGRDAVRAIEEGSRRAESGTQVAQAAGDAIHRLGDAIAASSSAAMQIASSTRQQSVGVEQIWQATREIDRIANETAQGSMKLEKAAGNMKNLSATMAEIVGRYRIES
jgi:methyl-accepting chemotaxis protein